MNQMKKIMIKPKIRVILLLLIRKKKEEDNLEHDEERREKEEEEENEAEDQSHQQPRPSQQQQLQQQQEGLQSPTTRGTLEGKGDSPPSAFEPIHRQKNNNNNNNNTLKVKKGVKISPPTNSKVRRNSMESVELSEVGRPKTPSSLPSSTQNRSPMPGRPSQPRPTTSMMSPSSLVSPPPPNLSISGGEIELDPESSRSTLAHPVYLQRIHFLCLLLTLVSIITSGISISTSNIPWAESLQVFSNSAPPQYRYRQQMTQAGLLSYEDCLGITAGYERLPFNLADCAYGGRVILGLVAMGLFSACLSLLFVYIRARTVWRAKLVKAVIILSLFLAIIMFIGGWGYWISSKGCPSVMSNSVYWSPILFVSSSIFHFQYTVGWILVVTASLLFMLALLLQCVALVIKTRVGGTGDYEEEGYTGINADLTFL